MISYKKKPICPRCKTNINVVELAIKFRCCFCESTFLKSGQSKLNKFLEQ